jgi:DNA-binding NtrC family response regulator
MVMPRLGGGDLGTALNARMPHIKVLRMSGYTEHAMVQRGALEPATPLLQKPFAVNTLLLAVRRVLDAPAGTTP